MKGLEKISNLETKINQMAEKLNSQMFQPPAQAQPAAAGGGSISRELASFGETVDFQTELYETKKALAGIAKSLDTLSKKMEYRISILEDRAKTLDRIPDLEERLGDIRQKLGPENVQKLRKLIFSSDEIIDEVIPELVNKKIRVKLDPAINEIRDMQDTINDFNSRLSHVKEEVLNLEKLRDDIQELRADKENLYKELDEEASKENERLDLLKQNVRRKIESVVEQFKQELREIRKIQADHIKNEVSNSFLNLIEPRFADSEKKQELFDERIKRMSQVESKLEKRIDSIEAPENVKKWLESRMSKLERGLVSDIASLQNKTLENSTHASKIGEDLKLFKVAMAEVPKRLGNQGNMINQLLDTKDYFAGRAETLASDLKALNDKLATLQANVTGLDQRVTNRESVLADNLNKQRDHLTSVREDLSRYLERELSNIRKSLQRAQTEQNKTTLAEFKAEIKRLSSTEEELKALRKGLEGAQSRLDRRVSDLEGGLKGAYPEIKLLEERISELESALQGLSGNLAEASEYHKSSDAVIKSELLKYVDNSIKILQKSIEERRSSDAKTQMAEFKDELKRLEFINQELAAFKASQEKRTDELSQEMAGLSGPITDLKALNKRVNELENILIATDKRLDVDSDRRTDQLNDLDNRLNLLTKATQDLGSSLANLEKRVGSDNEQLQRSLGKVISDKESLEKEFASQKGKMGELIRELRNL
jgi:chromosome segregation ATPase